MHITVACAKKSFSKLDLLNNYLRSPMTQDWLNGLATVCIEKLLDEIDISSIIDIFVSKNVRRTHSRGGGGTARQSVTDPTSDPGKLRD
jgi:hypothetical protein